MRLRTLWLPLIFVALAACGNGEEENEVVLTQEPQVYVDRNVLQFDTEYGSGTYVGATTYNTLIIENRGIQELQISQIAKEGPGAFTVRLPQELADGKALVLQSRQKAYVEVAFRPTEAKQYDGSLIIRSNDPKAADKQVTLTAKGVRAP